MNQSYGEPENSKNWYIIRAETENITGPLDADTMDALFRAKEIGEATRVKRKDDDDYVDFNTYLRRYYKKILEEKFNLAREQKKLPKRVAVFKVGTRLPRKCFEKEEHQIQARNFRVSSTITRPIEILSVADEVEEPEATLEVPQKVSRARARTLAA